MDNKGGTIWGSITDSLRKLLQVPVKEITHIKETDVPSACISKMSALGETLFKGLWTFLWGKYNY